MKKRDSDDIRYSRYQGKQTGFLHDRDGEFKLLEVPFQSGRGQRVEADGLLIEHSLWAQI
jgi:hypothetical protein